MSDKSKIVILSVISNSLLITTKIIVSIFTGSISILSEAFHSLTDLFASLITFFSVIYANKPPDKKHPYGHGKIENVSATLEAILIIIAAFFIVYESIDRFIHEKEIDYPVLGLVVMLLSFLVNYLVSKKIYDFLKKDYSVALEGNALHLRADMLASLGIILAFVSILIFKFYIVDPILALLVAIYMFYEGYLLLVKSFNPLLDHSLGSEELEKIEKYFHSNNYSVHNVKTRKSGNTIFIDFHLELSESMNLKSVHDICDNIENDLKLMFNNDIQVNIHVEPIEE
jgi:cation diffusion facilitator family transporter